MPATSIRLPFEFSWYCVAILSAVAGCNPSPPPATDGTSAPTINAVATPANTTPAHDTPPLEVTDFLDRKVTLPGVPKRIVSIAPKNTESLFALGAGDLVVGVTSYCNFPAEAKARDQVGGFSAKSLSLEKILSLQPDLVMAAGELHRPVIEQLEGLKIPVVALAAETFDELYRELRLIGTLTGHAAEAEQLVKGMQQRVAAVQERAQAIPTEERVTVLYQAWDDPFRAAGPASYPGQLIELCGAKNIIADTTDRFPQVSLEVILDRDPDVIVAPTMAGTPITVERLSARAGWGNLKAVRTQRLHVIDGDQVSRCGPRLATALEDMAHAIYPERFPMPGIGNAEETPGEPSP